MTKVVTVPKVNKRSRMASALGLAVPFVFLSAGVTLADWQDTKKRALSYHAAFDKVPMAYKGVVLETTNLHDKQTGNCLFSYGYEGSGSIASKTREAVPDNEFAKTLCASAEQKAQSEASGIALTGSEVREWIESIDGAAPSLTRSPGGRETYSATVPASRLGGLPGLPPGHSVTVHMTFATEDGKVLSYVTETDGIPLPQKRLTAELTMMRKIGYLEDGRPFFRGLESRFLVIDTTGGGHNTEAVTVHAISGPSVVTSEASAADGQ